MKLTVLVPSNDYKNSAGARIRYGRIASELKRRGIELTLRDIGQFDPAALDCDAVLISKCHDARSLIAAAVATERGKLVGVDLFDDYFSDRTDSRLLRYRSWLSQLIQLCDFALCSTSVMAQVIARYRADIPTHQLNDPSLDDETGELPILITRKGDLARDSMLIRAAWFGVGDNPYFPVGLADLAAHAETLGELRRQGFAIDLTILTNRRALTADGLSLITQLPIKARVEEWTESAERDLLRDALVTFLPVNARGFSAAKSLNRAVTALSAGCQVLSVGYPLYAPLEPLIYRNAGELVADVVGGSLRFSAGTMSEYRRLIACLASAQTEAQRLAEFLRGLKPQASCRSRPLRLVHGQLTRIETHGIIRAVDGLSIASPYCSAALDFDVVFRGVPSRLQMLVSRNASSRLLPHVRQQLKRAGDYLCVVDERADQANPPQARDWSKESIPFQLATYGSTIKEIQRRLTEAFGPGKTIFSEVSQLPFPAPGALAK